MKTVIGDFHVHTLLSPCAEIEMTPHHIVMQAAEYGIQLLAVTDHNASANAVAAIQLVNVMVLRCSREWKLNAGKKRI